MYYTDFMVDRAQHMRPLEYDLSENHNLLVRYLHDMGMLDNVPVGTLGPAEILTASDALAAPLRSLVVGGNSTQAGTPTPDAPVEIRSVENPVLMAAGKNLIINSDRAYSLTGSQYATYNIASGLDPNAVSALTVSLQATVPSSQRLMLYVNGMRIEDVQTYFSDNVYYVKNAANIKKILDAGSFRIYSTPYTGGSSVVTKIDTCQIELGTTATDYEPYVGTTVTLPVTLRSLPDGTRDTATYTYLRPSTREGWAWYAGEVTRTVGVIVGSDLTRYNASNGFIAYRANAVNALASRCRCSWTNVSESFSSANMTKECVQFTGLGTSAIYVAALENHSLDDFEYDYPLATPVTTQLDQIELPILPAPSVNIWATADATPTLTAQYVRNISAAINDMQEAIADI